MGRSFEGYDFGSPMSPPLEKTSIEHVTCPALNQTVEVRIKDDIVVGCCHEHNGCQIAWTKRNMKDYPNVTSYQKNLVKQCLVGKRGQEK
jgi:hypothetical protein